MFTTEHSAVFTISNSTPQSYQSRPGLREARPHSQGKFYRQEDSPLVSYTDALSRVAAERRPPIIRYNTYHGSLVVEGGRPFIMLTSCIISLRMPRLYNHWMLNSALVIEPMHTWQIHFD